MNARATIERAVDVTRLRGFVTSFADLLSASRDERAILESGRALLEGLIARDDWLPDAFARPHSDRYQQYLLHCDSHERFSVVSSCGVRGSRRRSTIMASGVWSACCAASKKWSASPVRSTARSRLRALTCCMRAPVDAVSPRIGDVHRVSNGRSDAPSISIHVYGANIGAVERATYAHDGTAKPFISGYANNVTPNLWDRSGNL